MFHLTITTDDVDRFVTDPEHVGTATGYVESDLLGGQRPGASGHGSTCSPGRGRARRRMRYRLHFSDGGGNPLTLLGHKDVHDDPGVDVWRDTSTLYVRVLAGHVPPGGDEGRVVGAGVITIHVPDFMRQLTTFRTERPAARPSHGVVRPAVPRPAVGGLRARG